MFMPILKYYIYIILYFGIGEEQEWFKSSPLSLNELGIFQIMWLAMELEK